MPLSPAEAQRRALFARRATWGMRNDLARAAQGSIYQAVLELNAGVIAAVAEADERTARQVKAVAEVFRKGVAPGERTRVHREIGAAAQKSVLRSYAQTVGRTPGGRYPYRKLARQPNKRYAGGALKKALGARNFYEASPEGLRFINITSLNRTARHWARLNAGAGPIGKGSRRRFQVRWSNLVVASLGLDQQARPGFFLPRGYWFSRQAGAVVPAGSSPTGTDEFYPMGTGPFRGRRRLDGVRAGGHSGPGLARRRPSKGIKARNFLDAGVATIARELPKGYERMYRRLWDQGVVGPGARSQVPSAPRPSARLRSRVRTTRLY